MYKKKLFEELVACEKILNTIQEAFANKHDGNTSSLLHDIEPHVHAIKELLQMNQLPSNILHIAMVCCMNLEYSLERFFLYPEKCHRIFYYEILVSFSELKYLVHWKYTLLENPSQLIDHRKQLMKNLNALHNSSPKEKIYKYKVSIYVLGYNRIEYTKQAIESIMEYTDFSRGDIELITINNGSTDGTEEYFDGLPHEKKLNFKHNRAGGVRGTFGDRMISEGEYIVGFSNDAVATPHWLEQLLQCIESSQDIAMAVPTCNEDSISRGQGIRIPYRNDVDDIENMQKFALEYNHHNPTDWEERFVLMPFVFIMRSDVASLPLDDPFYEKFFFGDDDLSTLLRRTGWRMILAKDTFLHHFGSITVGKAKNKDTSIAMKEMRKVYFSKWGVDAWDSSGSLPSFSSTLQWLTPKPNGRILWIDPKFGADFLHLKNIFRKQGTVHADAIILDDRYELDAKPYFDHCFRAATISDAIPILPEKYDVIGMGRYFHEIVRGNAIICLEQLYSLLKPSGVILVPVRNWGSASSLAEFFCSGGENQYRGASLSFHVLNIQKLLRDVTQHKELQNVRWQGFSFPQDTSLGEAIGSRLASLFSPSIAPDILKNNLMLSMIWFCFFRP